MTGDIRGCIRSFHMRHRRRRLLYYKWLQSYGGHKAFDHFPHVTHTANTTFAGDTQELSKENQTAVKRQKRNIGNMEVLQITDTTAQV